MQHTVVIGSLIGWDSVLDVYKGMESMQGVCDVKAEIKKRQWLLNRLSVQ